MLINLKEQYLLKELGTNFNRLESNQEGLDGNKSTSFYIKELVDILLKYEQSD